MSVLFAMLRVLVVGAAAMSSLRAVMAVRTPSYRHVARKWSKPPVPAVRSLSAPTSASAAAQTASHSHQVPTCGW